MNLSSRGGSDEDNGMISQSSDHWLSSASTSSSTAAAATEEEVYVALNKNMGEGRNALLWVLGNTSWKTRISIVHVHCPTKRVPMSMGGWFPESQTTEVQKAAYRKHEREEIEKILDEYVNLCEAIKGKRVKKEVIESEEVGQGLVEFIARHGVTELVMGAASDSKYYWRIRGPKSKAALTVQEHADPSCNITFLHKGKVVSRRRRGGIPEVANAAAAEGFSHFSYSELKVATNDFADSLKIGGGGFGWVYRGVLRNDIVAIKVLKPEGMQGQREFDREMSVLSKFSHPNLVKLVGACPKKYALVYEFLPNGSLEDRLARKNNSPALTWLARTRIAGEICAALVFLHDNKHHLILHGDLKPENILLDAGMTSKLGDFGLCRFLIQSVITASTVFCHTEHPGGTFFYMDPDILTLGQISAKSDVYSFGVILLRLLTGKPPMFIRKTVEDALTQESLGEIVDRSAGEWPPGASKQLLALGLSCCDPDRKNRPLAKEALKVIETLMKATYP